MTYWDDLDRALATFGNTEPERVALRELLSKLPERVDDVPPTEQERAQELGAEALYQSGALERVIAWSSRPRSTRVKLWLGHALFDLGRCHEAAPLFRQALDELNLQDWARVKLEELILCSMIQEPAPSIAQESLLDLWSARAKLGDDAPLMTELRRAIADLEVASVGRAEPELLRRVKSVFAADLIRVEGAYGTTGEPLPKN